MAWRKIEDKESNFIRVYEVTSRMHMTASFFPQNELPPNATHIDIADRPSGDHIWDEVGDVWVEDVENIKLSKKTVLEAQAREDFFNNSAEKAKLDTANSSIDTASSKAEIEAITL